MTAEDLARWSHALFGGKVLAETSLSEMLKFGKGGYGLGVGYFRSTLAGGEQAVGHMGGNIGTTASMVYSRKYGVSVVVMINAYHLKCVGKLTEEVGKITLDYLASEERYDLENLYRQEEHCLFPSPAPSPCPEQGPLLTNHRIQNEFALVTAICLADLRFA